jgi:hypothetical protein
MKTINVKIMDTNVKTSILEQGYKVITKKVKYLTTYMSQK